MFGYIHLDINAIPAMLEQALCVVRQVHTKDRTDTHFEDFVLSQDMQTRVRQAEV